MNWSRKPRLTAVGILCADHATPSTRKIGINFADKQRSLGRYSLLADYGHGVKFKPPWKLQRYSSWVFNSDVSTGRLQSFEMSVCVCVCVRACVRACWKDQKGSSHGLYNVLLMIVKSGWPVSRPTPELGTSQEREVCPPCLACSCNINRCVFYITIQFSCIMLHLIIIIFI
jgi:hypothetical protein